VPAGHLPLTWPRGVGQVPIYHAHNLTQDAKTQNCRYWEEESTPLFPFGFGLSYAKFIVVSTPSVAIGVPVQISVDVENAGTMAADDVAQLYLHQQAGGASRPIRELKGFERVTLGPSEKKTVKFSVGSVERTYWNSATKSWVEDAATFDVWAGGGSTAELHGTFVVGAKSRRRRLAMSARETAEGFSGEWPQGAEASSASRSDVRATLSRQSHDGVSRGSKHRHPNRPGDDLHDVRFEPRHDLPSINEGQTSLDAKPRQSGPRERRKEMPEIELQDAGGENHGRERERRRNDREHRERRGTGRSRT
jgi:Fibronectin type III-like domain